MSEQVLLIEFKYDLSRSEYEAAASQLAPLFAELTGLRWKIWIIDEAESIAGGIYMFQDETSVQDYLNGSLAAQVRSHPALSNLTAKVFEVMEAPSEVTRGPVRS
jgi:hypothetical protein